MDLKAWLPLFLYLSIQSITPGPNNLTCMYLGGKLGFRGSLRFISGSMLALFVKTLLCGLLNLTLSEHMPAVVSVLKWLGAAFMLYLAWSMCVSGWQEELSLPGQQNSSSFKSGVILQLLNGKSWIVSVSMFAVYVIPQSSKLSAILLTALLFLFLAALCSVIWAFFGTALKSFISKHRKPFGIVMGLSLLYCAITAVI